MKNLTYIKKFIYLLSAVLIAVIISSGCGIDNNKVDDYGKSDANGAPSDIESPVLSGTLKDRLGTDDIIWQDSFEADGVNYNIDIEYSVPDIERFPIYKLSRISDLDSRENEILERLFGDEYSKMQEADETPMKLKLDLEIYDLWFNFSGMAKNVKDS